MASYALVPRGSPLEVPSCREETEDVRGGSGRPRGQRRRQPQRRPGCGDRAEGKKNAEVREDLLKLYESYAVMYPNPRLYEERRERSELLRAASAASEASAAAAAPRGQQKKGRKGGLFRWLGFRSGDDADGGGSKREAPAPPGEYDDNDGDGNDHGGRLIYTSLDEDEEGDRSLCGTEDSLDLSCVPAEAWSLARFHLSSYGTSGGGSTGNSLRTARTAWETAGSSLMVVAGPGRVAEFRPSTGSSHHQRTSDGEYLESLLLRRQPRPGAGAGAGRHQRPGGKKGAAAESPAPPGHPGWSCGYARAATIGPNVLLVAWGLAEGSGNVVMYRRRKRSGEDDAVHWFAVAVISPTQAVRSNLQQADVFSDDEPGTSPALLRVTDLCPLVVEVDGGGPPAVTLAIARLGGYVELVPLPPKLWYGPEITVPVRAAKAGKSPYRNLPDLSLGPSVTAVTTSEYHTDVLCLEAWRTTVNSSTVWDEVKYPNAPPAEHILAATGSHGERRQRQVVTFWSVSTIFDDNGGGGQSNPNSDGAGGGGYTLHATVAEALDLGPVGPDVTVFASREIMRLWRKPRRVELREAVAIADRPPSAPSNDESLPTDPAKRVTTLSVAAPVTNLRFVRALKEQSTSSGGGGGATFLALLDWNGGLTMMDCGLLERVVAQNLVDEEFELLYRNDDPNAVIPLARIVSDRSQVWRRMHRSTALQDRAQSPASLQQSHCITGMQWLTERLSPSQQEKNGNGIEDRRPRLAFATCNPDRLWILPFPETSNDTSENSIGGDLPIVTSLSRNGATAALWTTRAGQIALLSSSSSRTECITSNMALSMCVLDKLDRRTIVQALVHESKFREAIQASEQLTPEDRESVSELVEKSKMELWKSTCDLESLESIRDSSYVVRQALSLYDCISEDSALQDNDQKCLLLFRQVHRIALQRIEGDLKSAASDGDGERCEIARELRSRQIALGTYELLCQYFAVEPSFEKFCIEFLPVSFLNLAKSLAKRAEIGGLSIVCFRHRHETMSTVEVVNEIPLSVRPYLYHHLLPVLADDDCEQSFFLTTNTESPLQEWSYMPQYLKENADIAVVVDDDDKAMVLDQKAESSFDEESLLLGLDQCFSVEGFYASRVDGIQNFSSSLEHTIELCRFGLSALGDSGGISMANMSSVSMSPAGGRLNRTLARAEALEGMLLDEIEAGAGLTPPSFVSLNLDDLEIMGAVEVVALVFEGLTDPAKVHSRFINALLPLLENGLIDTEEAGVDEAICSYCCGLLDKSIISEDQVDMPGLLRALQMCATFACLSRSSEDMDIRIIKERKALSSLAKYAFDRALQGASIVSLTVDDARSLIDDLWSIYESLPMRVRKNNGEERMEELHSIADVIFESLVTLDMLSLWPGCSGFSILSGNDGDQVATSALTALCRSFCNQIDEGVYPSGCKDLLASLISDVKELRGLRLFQSVETKKIITGSLLEPFVGLRQVKLVEDLLSMVPKEWIDRELACSVIMSFVDDVVFNKCDSDKAGEMLDAAVACRGLLTRYFPSAQAEFHASWRYLDAASFINNVLLRGIPSSSMRPEDLRNQYPFDVIDSLLNSHPELVIRDCEDWADPEFALQANQANRDLRSRGQASEDSQLLPALSGQIAPGVAIFHLAELLGLETGSAVTAVKCLVIHHGVAGGFHGAAAAICRTLLPDDNARGVDSCASAILQAVSKVVSHAEYGDVSTKEELCRKFFNWFAADVDPEQLVSFDKTLLTQAQLELVRLRDSQGVVKNKLHATRRLLVDTRTEYAAELCDLFSTLRHQASEYGVDDSLLDALSRFVIYWCIAQSTRPKAYQPSVAENANVRSLVELSSSLLLHVRKNEISLGSLEELQRILREQTAVARSHAPNSASRAPVEPDMEIVRRLQGRGYSEHGACRAVILTQSIGFDQALQWAISHSLDESFDDPYVILQDQNPVFFDEAGAQQLRACLALTDNIVRGKASMQTSLAVQANEESVAPPGDGEVARASIPVSSQKHPRSTMNAGRLNGGITVNGEVNAMEYQDAANKVIDTIPMNPNIVKTATEAFLSGSGIHDGDRVLSTKQPEPMPTKTNDSSFFETASEPFAPKPVPPMAQNEVAETSEKGWEDDDAWDFDDVEEKDIRSAAAVPPPPPPPLPPNDQPASMESCEGWEDDADLELLEDEYVPTIESEHAPPPNLAAATQTEVTTAAPPPPPPPPPQPTFENRDLGLLEDKHAPPTKLPAATQTEIATAAPPPPPPPPTLENKDLGSMEDQYVRKTENEHAQPPKLPGARQSEVTTAIPGSAAAPPPPPPPPPQATVEESHDGWEDDEELDLEDDGAMANDTEQTPPPKPPPAPKTDTQLESVSERMTPAAQKTNAPLKPKPVPSTTESKPAVVPTSQTERSVNKTQVIAPVASPPAPLVGVVSRTKPTAPHVLLKQPRPHQPPPKLGTNNAAKSTSSLRIEARNLTAVKQTLAKLGVSTSKSPPRKTVLPVTSSAPPPPPSRSSLLQRGNALFREAKKASSPTEEERQRLKAAGRRLLEKVRSSPSHSSSSAPKTPSASIPNGSHIGATGEETTIEFHLSQKQQPSPDLFASAFDGLEAGVTSTPKNDDDNTGGWDFDEEDAGEASSTSNNKDDGGWGFDDEVC